ncbi:hypothetical protein GIB67_004178 [Kingdonia uniflora]|uniref:Ribokinase n=1 Tax=Kingdonia uniflora TaxID=39325 RepID=A0A7J7LM53_9MAGN|nr:hypothetical protein GIB67_004178 [Kingdonia uniflora]
MEGIAVSPSRLSSNHHHHSITITPKLSKPLSPNKLSLKPLKLTISATNLSKTPTPITHNSPLVVVGSANADIYVEIDRLPKEGETISAANGQTLAGGKGANQAACSGKLSLCPTYFVGQVGEDAHGKLITKALEDGGVKLDYLNTVNGVPTGHAVVMLQSDGQNSIIIVGGANMCCWPELLSDEDLEVVRNAGIVLLQREIPDLVNIQVAKAARSAGVPVILDAGGMEGPIPLELLSFVDILSPNETELARLTGLPTDSFEQINQAVLRCHEMGLLMGLRDWPGVAAGSLKTIFLKELYNGQCIGPLIVGPKKLKTLKMFRCSGDWDKLLEVIADKVMSLVTHGLAAISNYLDLEILHLVKTLECTNTTLVSIANRYKLLRKLHIDGWKTNRIGDEGLITIAKRCPNLQELVLFGVNPTSLSLGILGWKRLQLGALIWFKVKVKKCRGVTCESAGWLRASRGSLAVNLDVNLDTAANEPLDIYPSEVAVVENEGLISHSATEADTASSSNGRSSLSKASTLVKDNQDHQSKCQGLMRRFSVGFNTIGGEAVTPRSNGCTGEALNSIEGVKQVLVKLGGKGSALFVQDKEPIRQPIIPAPTVLDTTGAGDTFTAAFAVALVENKSKRDCLEFAAAAASLCVQVKGAIPSMPDRKAVLDLLHSI